MRACKIITCNLTLKEIFGGLQGKWEKNIMTNFDGAFRVRVPVVEEMPAFSIMHKASKNRILNGIICLNRSKQQRVGDSPSRICCRMASWVEKMVSTHEMPV